MAAFKKAIRLVVAPPGQSEGLVLSTLDMEFDVTRSTKLSENTGNFTLFNVNEDTRNNLLVEGASLEFFAGYEGLGDPGLVFKANVTEVDPEKTLTGWRVDMVASTIKGGILTTTPVVLSYAPGAALTNVIDEVAGLINMVVYGLENANGISLPNGLVECGTARSALAYIERVLKDNGKGLYRDNGELIIFNQGEESFFDVVRLSYETGLISVAPFEETKAKKKSSSGSDAKDKTTQITFTSLLFAQLRPNGLMQIAEAEDQYNGNYIPTAIQYVGDSRNGAFNCVGIADKV